MTEKEFEAFQGSISDRKKLLLPYEHFVKEMFTYTARRPMHDWLKEYYDDSPKVNQKTVFNFVHWVRRRHSLPI